MKTILAVLFSSVSALSGTLQFEDGYEMKKNSVSYVQVNRSGIEVVGQDKNTCFISNKILKKNKHSKDSVAVLIERGFTLNCSGELKTLPSFFAKDFVLMKSIK